MKNFIKIISIAMALTTTLTVQGGNNSKSLECSLEQPSNCKFTATTNDAELSYC